MQTKSTKQEIDGILAALRQIHVNAFQCESNDPKYNAQRNLGGRTHYVDDETLRWHHSRITSSHHFHGGLLFRVTCSDALDMHNTRRGFRTAVFDVFGTIVYRPELENALSTSQKAITDADKQEIDLVDHYRKALAERLRHQNDAANETNKALTLLLGEQVAA